MKEKTATAFMDRLANAVLCHLEYDEKKKQWRKPKAKPNTRQCTYMGTLRNGKPHGYGMLLYFTPSFGSYMKYRGGWKNGRFHGKGKQVWMYSSHSCKYSGFYKNGRKHGFGCEDSLGGKYFGWFENGMRRSKEGNKKAL